MIVWALLAVATAVVALSCAGMLAAPGVYARLHFTMPAATLAPPTVAAAVLVEESLSGASVKALLVSFVLLVTGPIVVHATARQVRIHEDGALKARPHELP